ncbi:conserved hypothetical protein [Methanocaldococcus infernus ME]|uniref:Uncharacterized protein n=1 Tax=Methanocaldococcus infernus (strain DSM 11812 / JCM 15783 / ME) TaxID=573063 RepID=D5VSI8_METIM|nr:conserved hypothetical protein [Methanocaldococcus infernus ME]
MIKKLLFLLFLLLFLPYGSSLSIGDLKIDNESLEASKTFTIEKSENLEYFISFQHYGTRTKDITYGVYLNGELIYSIKPVHIKNKPYPVVKINVSKLLKNGSNTITLKLEKGDIKGGYYKLNDISLEVKASAPIPILAIALVSLVVPLLVVRQ